MEIFKASVDTRNFEFTAYSDTWLGAVEILETTFKNHIKGSGGTMTWAEIKDDVFVESIILNTGRVR